MRPPGCESRRQAGPAGPAPPRPGRAPPPLAPSLPSSPRCPPPAANRPPCRPLGPAPRAALARTPVVAPPVPPPPPRPRAARRGPAPPGQIWRGGPGGGEVGEVGWAGRWHAHRRCRTRSPPHTTRRSNFSCLGADMEQVAEACGDGQGAALPRPLQQGVGCHSGAHADGRNAGRVQWRDTWVGHARLGLQHAANALPWRVGVVGGIDRQQLNHTERGGERVWCWWPGQRPARAAGSRVGMRRPSRARTSLSIKEAHRALRPPSPSGTWTWGTRASANVKGCPAHRGCPRRQAGAGQPAVHAPQPVPPPPTPPPLRPPLTPNNPHPPPFPPPASA